jgi:hypothetical protein
MLNEALFAFDVYDKSSKGVLSIQDIEAMFSDLYGQKSVGSSAQNPYTAM